MVQFDFNFSLFWRCASRVITSLLNIARASHMEVSFEIGGEPFNEYSEDNVRLNELIAADVILNYMRGRFNFPKYNTTILQSKDLPKSLLKSAVDIIDGTIGNLYIKHNGSNWKREKKVELKEPGLLFVFLADPKSTTVVAYICFKLCLDDEDDLVLYLYEIHITEEHQGKGLGQFLIDDFHKLCVDLVKSSNKLYKLLVGMALTVFSDNERALLWYRNMGYKLTVDSPVDKVLRNGKVIKPDYYLLKHVITI